MEDYIVFFDSVLGLKFRRGYRDNNFVTDVTLPESDLGFFGDEDADWINLDMLTLSISEYWQSRYPANLEAEAMSGSQIDLSWENNGINDYDGVKIERSLDNETFSVIATLSGGTSYSDNGLDGDTTYYYKLRYFRN